MFKPVRINVLGASGSGKTTLGSALAVQTGYPCFDVDRYFHVPSNPPFQFQYPPEERLPRLVADLTPHVSWILSGSVITFGKHPLLDFSLVVFLWLPPEIRLERIRRREHQQFGSRLEPGGDMYNSHIAFMEWASAYDSGQAERNNLMIHEAWLVRQGAPVLRLDGTLSVSEQVMCVHQALQQTML